MGEFGLVGFLTALCMGGMIGGVLVLAERSGRRRRAMEEKEKTPRVSPLIRVAKRRMASRLIGREAYYRSRRFGKRTGRVTAVDGSGRIRLDVGGTNVRRSGHRVYFL
jgi:ribosomal protein L35AE/L33A